MPAVAAVLPYVVAAAAAVAVDGYVKGEDARKKQEEAASQSRKAQEQSKQETRAQQAQAQAAESRRQIREERVRKARILQSSENTGTQGSSGEVGALDSLSTMFSTEVGVNAGKKASGERQSQYAQDAADAQFSFDSATRDASSASAQMSLGTSLFSAAGGFSTLANM